MTEEQYEALLAKLDEDITSLTSDELEQLHAKITEHGLELKAQVADTPVGDDLDQLTADGARLSEALAAITAEQAARAEAAAEASGKADEAFAAFTEPEAEPEPEPVAPKPVADVARRRPLKPVPEPDEPQVVVAAAVGSEGFGGVFRASDDVAQAMWDAKKRGPNGSTTVARISRDTGRELGADPYVNWSILNDLSRSTQAYRQADSQAPLTAGGFCAPTEPVYDYFQQGSRDGIVDLPEANARRGRILYPEIFNIRDVMVQASVGWETTSTMDHDGVEKPCYTVACGDGVTYDVNAYSTCQKYSNFDL